CPAGLTAKSWKGSGTWGTVAYAKQLGVKVELHPLTEGLGITGTHELDKFHTSIRRQRLNLSYTPSTGSVKKSIPDTDEGSFS
ncbi:MAG: hypothetical protein F6K04_25420, partial [Leptolyngbya sp. SIO4C5]|nr:hypothetical protein [Leptolyngbya sp. SIO4C5]